MISFSIGMCSDVQWHHEKRKNVRNALTWQFLTYCFIESTQFPLFGRNLSIKTNASCDQTRLCSITFLWCIYFATVLFLWPGCSRCLWIFLGQTFWVDATIHVSRRFTDVPGLSSSLFSRCPSEGFRIVPFRSVFEVLYRAKKHRDQGNLNANVVAAGMARIGLMLIPDGCSRRWCKKLSYSSQMYFENQEKRAKKTSPHACWPHWRNNCEDVPLFWFTNNCHVNVCPLKDLAHPPPGVCSWFLSIFSSGICQSPGGSHVATCQLAPL